MLKQPDVSEMGTKVTTSVGYHFMEQDVMASMLHDLYQCPICEEVSLLDSIDQRWNLDKLVTEFGLECGHKFPHFGALKPLKGRMKPFMEALIKSEVKAPSGSVFSRTVQRSHSFVGSMMFYLWWAFQTNNAPVGSTAGKHDSTTYGWVDCAAAVSSGTPKFFVRNISSMDALSDLVSVYAVPGFVAGATVANFGIVIGLGQLGATPSDSGMSLPIANGNGSNQLQYGAVVLNTPIIAGQVTSLNLVRTFTNNYSQSLTTSEIGMIAQVASSAVQSETGATTNVNAADNFMWIHDLFSAYQTIPAGQTLTVTYTIQTST